eukprot:1194864-Pyramimonas_sp.AAC.1
MNPQVSCLVPRWFHDGSDVASVTEPSEFTGFPEHAFVQPSQLQEAMLRETAVSWMRDRLTKTLPK